MLLCSPSREHSNTALALHPVPRAAGAVVSKDKSRDIIQIESVEIKNIRRGKVFSL